MKYNFDEIIDRINEPGSYSVKWADNELIRNFIGLKADHLPEDRAVYFTADMDFRSSPQIQSALMDVVKHNIYGYTDVIPEYYEAVQGWFKRRFDWEFDTSDIYITAGTHHAVQICIDKYTKEGDGIILLTPSYFYDADVNPKNRHLVKIPMLKSDVNYYTVDWDAFEKACEDPQNTMFILIQPHNPTGRIYTEEELKKMGEICEKNGVLVISDEVHIDLTRDGNKILPAMKVMGTKNVISTTAINKTFNCAGLAVTNVIVCDPELKAKWSGYNNTTSPFGVAACIAAYNESEEWVEALNEYLDKLLHRAVDRITAEMPKCKVAYPEATYVLWIDFADYGLSDDELEERLLNQAHVLLSNGAAMDQLPGEQMRRMCLTSTIEVLDGAIDRMVEAFKDVN